ncbi:hypothetical protein JHK82_032518 [Glycine max]|nr:hypothetical protein JHK85_033226 [Glycine max]KAG5118098.1 hypothetical protein JHK82_032518 [Glycine max]
MPKTSKVITCKATICWGIGKPITVEEIQVDPPKATEVRVKMLCASICHTDISSTEGFPHGKFPLALGHEGVGVIESVGDQVKNLKEGDVVIPTFLGQYNTSRMSIRGERIYHITSCATWSEYMVSDANYILKVDPTIDRAHASFISCGFSTGFGAAWKEANVESGSTVAVFGLGAVGLGAVIGAKLQGASRIIGIDTNENKREKGEAFGITDFINPGDSDNSASELVKELTGGMGVDYSFECTGVSTVLTESLEATKIGTGKTIVISVGAEPILPVGLFAILHGRTLKGTLFGGLKAVSDLSIVAEKCQKKIMCCINGSIIESVGDQVTNLKEGDVVIPTYIGECQECENCVSEKTNLCMTYPVRWTGLMPDNTSRMSIRGERIYHIFSCATWSEYMVSDANYVLKVDPTIDRAHASFISCGFSTGFGAAWKEAKVESGSTVAVFGLGAVGLGAVIGSKMQGASRIIGIDTNENKRAKGEAFGITDFINPGDSNKSASELVKELSGGMGADYSFECTGVSTLLSESLEATKIVSFTLSKTVRFFGLVQ